MRILVVNCGSSSVKAEIIHPQTGQRFDSMKIERIGTPRCVVHLNGQSIPLPNKEHKEALQEILPKFAKDIDAIGHRVVHGGDLFSKPVRVDDQVEQAIADLIPLAPLHNPANLAGIQVCRSLFPQLLQVAVFDTAFHATLPRRAKYYALPKDLCEKHGVRRYGFHGPSHQWVAQLGATYLNEDIRDLRIITCHLGNGASVCAVEYGRSVETSMGQTPLEGLVMGTRSGDVDAGVLFNLARKEGLSLDELDHLLNKQSGLTGLSKIGNDMRDIESKAANGDDNCRLAIHVFAHRLRKYIGAYAAVMGGVDVIVFTGGIGQNSALIRHRVAQRFDFLGARIHEDRNRDASVDFENPVCRISDDRSRVSVLVAATDEQRAISMAVEELAEEQDKVDQNYTIPIAVSARHIHLTRDAVNHLFGEGHKLQVHRPISQPGQFAAVEKVDLIGPKRSIKGVRVIGPVRPRVQVEISRTDEFTLGIDAPIRNSGDVKNSPGITLVGPKGTLNIKEGVICARRHIHMTPDDAKKFGVKDKDVVEVAIDSAGRNLTFGDVLVRVSRRYVLEMHIDTDEANAAELRPDVQGVLIGTMGNAKLRRKNIPHG